MKSELHVLFLVVLFLLSLPLAGVLASLFPSKMLGTGGDSEDPTLGLQPVFLGPSIHTPRTAGQHQPPACLLRAAGPG